MSGGLMSCGLKSGGLMSGGLMSGGLKSYDRISHAPSVCMYLYLFLRHGYKNYTIIMKIIKYG